MSLAHADRQWVEAARIRRCTAENPHRWQTRSSEWAARLAEVTTAAP